MNQDPITDIRTEVIEAIDLALQHPEDGGARLMGLSKTYSDCLELALAAAIIHFFREDPDLAMDQLADVAERWPSMYELDRWDLVDFIRLRKIFGTDVEIAGWKYTRAVFTTNYVKHLKGRGDLFAWVAYEQKKLQKTGDYNRLFLLRNLVWALHRTPALSHDKNRIQDQVRDIDRWLIRILRGKLSGHRPRKRTHVTRIAICAGLLKHGRRCMHARLVLDYARNLAHHNPDVTVLVLVSNEIPFDIPPFLPAILSSGARVTDDFRGSLHELYKRIVEPTLRERVRFEYMGLANPGWQDLMAPIRRLIEFDPDVAMHYGAKYHNESYFMRRVLFDLIPTAYFFSQMNNGVDTYNDIYLARNDQPLVGTYDQSKVRIAPPPVRPEVIREKLEGRPACYAPTDIKRTEGEITLVTVLAGDRMAKLLKTYPAPMRQQLMSLLEISNDVRWIWVGPSNPSAVLAVDELFSRYHKEGRLTIRTFEQDLISFYEHCDIFLHLPGITGGSGGMTMAVSCSVPVLCFRNTDAAGRILDQNKFDPADIEGFLDRAKKLIGSPEMRRRVAAEALDFYNSMDIASQTRDTMNGLNEAIAAFNKRTTFQGEPE